MASIEDQISSNRTKSILLILIVPIILILIAFVIGSVWGNPFLGIFAGTGIAIIYRKELFKWIYK